MRGRRPCCALALASCKPWRSRRRGLVLESHAVLTTVSDCLATMAGLLESHAVLTTVSDCLATMAGCRPSPTERRVLHVEEKCRRREPRRDARPGGWRPR